MGTGITGKGIKAQSSTPKDLTPGLVEARIVGLSVIKTEESKIMNKEGYPEFKLQIKLEGRPPQDPDFVGWQKEPNDPSKGHWKGQFKVITSSNWPIKMFKFKSKKESDNGKEIVVTAENQILNVLLEIAIACGKPKLFEETQYQKEFSSWSDYIKQMNQDLKFANCYLWWCLGGQKTRDAKGYVKYFVYMPDKKACQGKPRIAATKEELCEFDETAMIYVHKDFHNAPSNNNNNTNNNVDVENEDFDASEIDVNDADFGSTDMGTDETLFEGATEFDTTGFGEIEEEF